MLSRVLTFIQKHGAGGPASPSPAAAVRERRREGPSSNGEVGSWNRKHDSTSTSIDRINRVIRVVAATMVILSTVSTLLVSRSLLVSKAPLDMEANVPVPANLNENETQVDSGTGPVEAVKVPTEFLQWETWTAVCRKRYLKNDTFGRLRAPLVDKVDVKEIVERMNTSIRLIPTVAVLDKEGVAKFNQDTLKTYPTDVIIKPAHKSGGVAKYSDGIYHCFKGCKYPGKHNESDAAFRIMKKNMEFDVSTVYFFSHRERQYKFCQHRIIVEELLPMENMKEFHWWVVNGMPVYASIRYNDDETGGRSGSYYSTRFHLLDMGSANTTSLPPKPRKWDEMRILARQLTSFIDGVVRLDLFANDEAVWFGEYTFQSQSCLHFSKKPVSSDAILYHILHGKIKPDDVTPQLVERYINGPPPETKNSGFEDHDNSTLGTMVGSFIERPSDIASFPSFPAGTTSLLQKYLTPAVWKECKDKIDKFGYTFQQAIFSGCKWTNSSVGLYAGSRSSYYSFAPLFDKVIKAYHDHNPTDKHITSMDYNELKFSPLPPDEDAMVVSTRIRVSRNLASFPLGTQVNRDERREIEKLIIASLTNLTGTLKGKYYSLSTMSDEERHQLVEDHFLFTNGDKYLESAGLERDWPEARGIFTNDNKTFLVWVNEEDHLRIISIQKGSDISTILKRLSNAISTIEKKLKFSYDEHLGYTASCPTNIGTGLRASMHVRLPKLTGANPKLLYEIADKYELQIRGTHGEHTETKDGIMDVSNRKRIGRSEVKLVQDVYDGLRAMIRAEKSL